LRATRAASTIASLAVGAAFLGLWFWLLPAWLHFRVEAPSATPWRWVGLAPAALGFFVSIRCVWDFGWSGGGTPAPIAPPTELVVAGMYRYVRNPMFLGFFIGWVGLWIAFGEANIVAILIAAAAVLGVHLFVVYYEEPTLRGKFGAAYEEYRRNVPRWIPRLRAWNGGL
jgi:protein-S-isoprenylcysteine O-methyltransferase Ste14